MNQNCVQVVLVLVLGRRFVIRKNRKFNISSDFKHNVKVKIKYLKFLSQLLVNAVES